MFLTFIEIWNNNHYSETVCGRIVQTKCSQQFFQHAVKQKKIVFGVRPEKFYFIQLFRAVTYCVEKEIESALRHRQVCLPKICLIELKMD